MIWAALSKIAASLVIAMWMYWMRVPYALVVLLVAQGLDLFEGMLIALAKREFQGRKLYVGILLKISVWPILTVCDLVEVPLNLSFHLETYGAWAFVAYEFQSIIQTYGTVRPLPKIIRVASDKAAEWFSMSPDMDTTKVENFSKRYETEATPEHPNPPAPVVVTGTRETHTEARGD
jgi:phage-related holin